MAEITLTLRLFGALRDHGPSTTVVVPRGASAADVRAALAEAIAADPALLSISALASEHEVLGEGATFDRDQELAVLPPVCGG
jgi:hypothetical protein